MLNHELGLFLTSILLVSSADITAYRNYKSNTNEMYRVYIGGLFEIFRPFNNKTGCNTSAIMEISLLRLEMALFTLNRINQDDTILPGVELVLVPKQTCVSNSVALSQVLSYFSCNSSISKSTKGIIGPRTSAMSLPTATVLGLMQIPQISYRATADRFSNKEEFPYFFRTYPADSFQVLAIVELLKHFEWHYVSFLYEDDEYGRNAHDRFEKLIRQTSICINYSYRLPTTVDSHKIKLVAKKLFRRSATKVVITFLLENNLVSLFREVHQLHQCHDKRIQWIGSDSWRELTLSDLTITSSKFDTPNSIISDVIDGAIQFDLHSPTNPAFNNYLRSTTRKEARDLNPGIYEHFIKTFKCPKQSNCNNKSLSTLFDQKGNVSFLWEDGVANTVFAFAYALNNALKDLCPNRRAAECVEFHRMNGSTFRYYLRNVSFSTSFGEDFLFDSNQNGMMHYHVQVFQSKSFQWTNIGEFSKNHILEMNLEAVKEYNLSNITSKCGKTCAKHEYRQSDNGKKCCWQCRTCPPNHVLRRSYHRAGLLSPCIPCKKTERVLVNKCVNLEENFLSFNSVFGGIVAASSGVGIILTLFVAFVFLRFRQTPVIRASGRELSIVMLIGVLLIFLSMFSYCLRPSNLLCGIRRLSVGFFFSIIFAGLLTKSLRISLIFNKFGKEMVKDYNVFLRPVPQVVFTLALVAVEVLVIVVWFISSPPKAILKIPSVDIPPEERYIYCVCNDLKFPYLLIGSLYPALMLIACLIFAIQIRKVPSGFNEAKYIGFAVYTTLVIWLVRSSTYYSKVTPHVEIREGVFCLCIILNNFIFLVSIFGPRVYVVLFRSEKNNEKSVLGRTHNIRSSVDLVQNQSSNKETLHVSSNNSSGQTKKRVEGVRRRSLPAVMPNFD